MKKVGQLLCAISLVFFFLLATGCTRLSTVGGTVGGSSGTSSSGGGTGGGTSGAGSGGSGSGSGSGTGGGTPTSAELFGISTNASSQFGVAVGTGGTILQSTSTGSSSSANFPIWTLVTSPTPNTLRSVSFDTNSVTGSLANVLAVGDGGVILENTSSGGNLPSPWLLGSSTGGFTVSDPGCAGTNASNFTPTLFGAAVFTNSNEQAVVVGGPFTDSCATTKGVIAVATSSAGVTPYNGFQLVDAFGVTPFPAVSFRGVSYAQRAAGSAFVVVVGDFGNIFIGTVATGLRNAAAWATNTRSDGATPQLNGVAIAQDNANAIAVGNSGAIYVNSNIGSTTVWTRLAIPGGIPASNYTGVHFTTGSSLTAVVVGGSATQILVIGNCCNGASTVTNVTPTISGLGALDATWGGIGPSAGLEVASGVGGFILESDNGGSPTWVRDH